MADIDLTNVPLDLAVQLNISVFAAGLLMTAILLLVFLLPIVILTRGRNAIAVLLVGVPLLSFCVALGWTPLFTIIIMVFLIALMLSNKIKEVFS